MHIKVILGMRNGQLIWNGGVFENTCVTPKAQAAQEDSLQLTQDK